MNTRFAAHLSVFSIFAMLVLSFSFGFNNYIRTEKAIIADLNRALQQTIMQKSNQWISRDTLQTYSRLSSIFGNPVSIESYDKDFSEALAFTEIKEKTGIIIQVKNKNGGINPQPITGKELSDYYLASDTVIWLSSTPDMPGFMPDNVGISFQGYANCTPFILFMLMDKQLPGIFLLLAFISGCILFFLRRIKPQENDVETEEHALSFGNLLLSFHKNSFYREDGEKLKLTPQQYSLMEMFFLSSSHILSRTDISESLWPGKTNADETLNTLVRRLRPLIEENSNLKITTDRGRAYILEIRDENQLKNG